MSTFTIETLRTAIDALPKAQRMRIIAGCPMVPPESVTHHKRTNVFWLGTEATECMLSTSTPVQSAFPSFTGVEMEPYASRDDHRKLFEDMIEDLAKGVNIPPPEAGA